MSQTIATNLLRLRKDRGLTQEQVAQRAGMSRSAYRSLEKGRSDARAETLRLLGGALDVSLADLLSPVEPLTHVRFRSLKRLRSRDQVLAEVGRWLRDFNDLEDLTGQRQAHGLKSIWSAVSSTAGADIPAIAGRVRSHFRLNEREPVHDICGLLESKGVKVYSLPINNDAFMGLSVGEEDGGPAVIVNTWARLPVETWIFSAAHELAHLLLHLSAYDVDEHQEDAEQEKQANQFASHFLMPEAVFRDEWEEAAGLPLVDRVFKVKRVFRVSWRTVLYRVAESLPDDKRFVVWKRFNEEHKKHKGRALLRHDEPLGISKEIYQDPLGALARASEPAGMAPDDFREDRLSLLVRRAIEAETISLSRGAEILRLPLVKMRELSASWDA